MPPRWIHSDENLAAHIESAKARALRADWNTGSLGLRAVELQALTIATCYELARLVGSTETRTDDQGNQTVLIQVPDSTDAPVSRVNAAGRLYASLYCLSRPGRPSSDVETVAPVTETGGLPVAAVVAIVVVSGAAVAYLGHEASRVVDRELARKEQTRQMVKKHTAALSVIAAHTARELREQKMLPLDAASRAVLDDLHAEQKDLISRGAEPFGDFLPRQVQTGAGVAAVATPMVLAVGGIAAAYFILKGYL